MWKDVKQVVTLMSGRKNLSGGQNHLQEAHDGVCLLCSRVVTTSVAEAEGAGRGGERR